VVYCEGMHGTNAMGRKENKHDGKSMEAMAVFSPTSF